MMESSTAEFEIEEAKRITDEPRGHQKPKLDRRFVTQMNMNDPPLCLVSGLRYAPRIFDKLSEQMKIICVIKIRCGEFYKSR